MTTRWAVVSIPVTVAGTWSTPIGASSRASGTCIRQGCDSSVRDGEDARPAPCMRTVGVFSHALLSPSPAAT
jgi:hypothetical protein